MRGKAEDTGGLSLSKDANEATYDFRPRTCVIIFLDCSSQKGRQNSLFSVFVALIQGVRNRRGLFLPRSPGYPSMGYRYHYPARQCRTTVGGQTQ